MAKLKITAKDGKILNIDIPEGTDPSQYSTIVDDVMRDYESKTQTLTKEDYMKAYEQIPIPASIPGGPIVPGTKVPMIQSIEEFKKEVPEKLAEDIGKAGYPRLGALAGTAAYLAPEIALSAPLGEISVPGAKAGVKIAKKAAKFTFGPRLKTAAKALGKAEEEAGIAVEAINRNLPRTRQAMLDTLESWKPLHKASVENIRNIGKEGLNIIRKQAGDLLDFLKIAKAKAPKQLLTSREIAMLSKIKDNVTKALVKEAPEVGHKITEYASAAKRAELLKKLGKVAGYGGGAAALYGLGHSLLNK